MADVLIMTSQCGCTRPLSQSYIVMHMLFGNESNMAVDASGVVRFHQQAKIMKNTHEARPSIKNGMTNVLMEV